MTPRNERGAAKRPPALPDGARAPDPRPPAVTVVCLGNTLMADDGAGAAVARRLEGRLPDGCGLDVRTYADMGLVAILCASRAVVIVDALDAGAEAGAVFRFSPDEAGVTKTRTHNTHGMGIGYAITSARMMGVDPPVVVFGVQVGDVRPLPDTLSEAVSQAVPEVAELVIAEVRSLLGAPQQAEAS